MATTAAMSDARHSKVAWVRGLPWPEIDTVRTLIQRLVWRSLFLKTRVFGLKMIDWIPSLSLNVFNTSSPPPKKKDRNQSIILE